MNKFRKGMQFKNLQTGQVVKLINKKNDDFWQAAVVSGRNKKSHRIGEKTLSKYYREK